MTRTFYFPAETDMLWLGGATQKAENNIQALRLLNQLELEPREPTLEEQNELALYTGWGDSQVLRAKFSQLREMVSEEEWDAVRTSTLNAHYTALPIIRAIWAGIMRLGAHKLPSLRILDPSAGIGHFRSTMPAPLREGARWVEVELDSVTARILKQLHPPIEGKSTVFQKGFQEVPLLDNQFDLVISNIPFGNYPVPDRSIKEAFLKASIHDYFFAKAVSLARPGGVIAFITSRYTLDKKNKRVREWLALRADLLAAVRLPDTTFKANAGTEVVTDILFLRKRSDLRTDGMPSWVETSEIDLDADSVENDEEGDGTARHNQIYCEHPEWLIGEVTTKRGMYRSGEYTLRYDGERPIGEIAAELLCSVLPEDGLLEGYGGSEKTEIVVETTVSAHAISIPENAPLDHRRRLEGLREIYDGAQKLLDMEVNGHSTESIESQRETLNGAYNRFFARFGPISNKLHQKLLGDSPALPFLLALEYDYDPLSNSAKKALIFSESTVRSAVRAEEIHNCHDALLFCLNQTGKVDLDWIATLANVTVEQAENELAGKILWTPEGRWETTDQYLSGNILEKLNAAKAMLNVEPRLKDTVEALGGAMPKPLKAGQIKARLGSGWIPAQYIEAFIADILPGVNAQVTHMPQLGAWKLSVRNKWYVPAENTTRWGTERKGALELIEIGLNAGTPVVHDEIEDKRVLNREATLAAQAKLEELKARFETWLWQDSERAEHLAQIYNARFNVFARPRHDGSHLTFPGLSKFVTPRPLQKDAVWFALQSQAALVGDEVGLGKTLTAILSIKEAIRLGTAHKALIVVPNHLTEQWRDAFLLAYPNAQILCAGKDDFKKARRGEFLSRIATGRWDAVIVPQSSFKLLPVSPDVLNRFIEEELDELQTFLQELKAEDGYDRRAEKEIVKAIKRFEAKLVTKSEMDKDSLETITWERLGVDLLVVDEFHCLPYEARVLTNMGELPIGEIVEKRLPVLVQSVDLETQEIKWMPVTDWFKNPQSAPMVRITHEKGVLECTANHKIWTEEEGYVEAGKLMPQHTLKNLPGLQKGICTEYERKSGAEADPLFQRVSKKWPTQDRNETLSSMRKGIYFPFTGENQQRQTSLLRMFLRSKMAHGSTGTNRTGKRIYASNVGCCSSGKQRTTFPGNISSNESKQPNSKGRCQEENISEKFRAHISCQGWEREADCSTRSGCQCAAVAYGISHSNRTGKRPVQISTKLLQSGCSRSCAKTGNRDRWTFPQDEEVEISRQTENGSAERSRVVRVTFLESESGFRSSIGAGRNKEVYCLEVAKTHNFFADGVLVSNCYKNLYFHTKMTRIAGLPNADSQRAFDMFIKVRNLLENGGRFIGLTGTPITNTMAEAFTMQRYFQYETLRYLGLAHFDSWAQMFADTVMMPEMTPSGGGFRVNTRLARFTNIPELAAMLSQFMIMRRWQQVSGEVERPSLYGGKPVTVSLPGSTQLKEFVKELAERAEAVRGGRIDPRVDNMLKITSEGRKAALDMRLLLPGTPDLNSSKINTAGWVISQIYHRADTFKSAQLVFCDLGTPKPHKDSVVLRENEEESDSLELEEELGFDNVYADLKSKLIGHRVQADEIAFIHDAKSPTARSLLFQAVREGRIRILIGSTEKMGTGMNVQTKAVAMHHLDAPWRPADLEQREGRLLRQGNCYPEVFSFVYITEGSFDGYVWQILETKARFIAQFLMGQTDAREIDDVSETVLSMAEIKALASGNPKIIERVMIQNELLKLEHLRASWQSNRRDSQRRLAMSEKELEQVLTRLGFLRKAAEVRNSHPGEKFAMTVAGSTHTERRLAGQALIAAAGDLKLEADRSGKEARKHAGTYRGFTLWLRARPNSERSMYELVRVDEGGVDILLDYGVLQVLAAHVSESETGTVMSIDAVIRSIDGEISKNIERQEYLTRQIQTFKAALSEEWEHAEKLGNLTGRLAVLDRELLDSGVNLPDSTVPENGEGESIKIVRTEAVLEEPVEADNAKVEFDLEAILQRLDELHAAMPAYEEPVVSVPSPAQEAIPITLEVVSRFEREAQAAQAMADLGRSLLSGQQMSLEAWLGAHPVDQAAKKKTTIRKKKVSASNDTVQLTLF